jgi:hypothetical protein
MLWRRFHTKYFLFTDGGCLLQIKCNEVILEAVDVAKALIEYVSTNTVEVMVFGAATKSGLVR